MMYVCVCMCMYVCMWCAGSFDDDERSRALLRGYQVPRFFRDDLLASQPVADLLTVPILDLADRWRS